MSDRPLFPPFAKPVLGAAIVLNLIVFTGVSRALPIAALMMVANLWLCLLAYWALLGYVFRRRGNLAPEEAGQSPSRKSSPISE